MVRAGSGQPAGPDHLGRHARHGRLRRHVLQHDAARRRCAQQLPTLMLPSTLAPALIMTLAPILGWRSPVSLPVPPSVTPCSSEQLSPSVAVSPMTMPVPWSSMMPMPICGRRIDVDGKDARALALQVEREVAPALLQQLVGEAMRDEGVEALEVEQRLDVAAAGGIAVVDGREIGAEGPAELGAIGEHLRRRSGR